jgi:hypothetical protein
MCGHHHHHRRERGRDVESAGRDVKTGGRGEKDRSLLVSDRERDEVSTLLRDHAAEGRLTAEELDERVGRALAARTGADLDAVLAEFGPVWAIGFWGFAVFMHGRAVRFGVRRPHTTI